MDEVIGVIPGGTWLKLGLKVIDLVRNQLQKNPNAGEQDFDRLSEQLSSLGQRMDEERLTECRAAVEHLFVALNAQDVELRNDQLAAATGLFTKLSIAQLPPEQAYLNVIGYWGNYQYLIIRNSDMQALAQVYTCVRRHPVTGFGPFSQHFSSDLGDRHRRLVELGHDLGQPYSHSLHNEMESELSKSLSSLARRQRLDPLVEVGTPVLGFGIVALGTIFRMHGAGVRGAQGVTDSILKDHASKMDSLKNKVSTLQYAKTILDEYRQLQDPFVAEVSAICDERLTELNLISPNDFEHLRRVMDV